MNELKPCPFCGSAARREVFDSERVKGVLFVCCNHARFGGACPDPNWYVTEEAWNARKEPTMADDLIAALEWAVGQAQGCQADEVFVLGQLLADLRAGNLVRREDVATLNGDFACAVAYDSGQIAGAAQERAKVVAWLQKRGDCWSTDDEIADAIAAGAHLK